MTVWVDAHLSPGIALWLASTFGVEARPVRELGLREAEDETIFMEARRVGAVVITKDIDFVDLLDRLGPPPQIVWLTCGNTSDAELRRIFGLRFPEAMRMLESGESLIEIGPV